VTIAGAKRRRTSPVADGRTAGRPRDEQATRAILDAAQRQLDDDGFGRMSLESVAAEAGVSRATVYRRFDGKADLVTAAVAERAVAASPAPTGDARRDLVAMLRDFELRFGAHCLEVVGGLYGLREEPGAMELHRERVVQPRTGYARRLLAQAQAEGDLAPGVDLDLALEMLVGAVLARRVMGTPPDRGWAVRAVDAVFTGRTTRRR
jgi:AcrR family transcriptional regulator